MADDDLWPDDPFKGIGVIPPVQVLREQATALTNRARGALRGNVDSTIDGATVVHDLDVHVPALDYTATLVRVKHSVSRLYPAKVDVSAGGTLATVGLANSEPAFRVVLKKAFANERVVNLLATLLAQAKAT